MPLCQVNIPPVGPLPIDTYRADLRRALAQVSKSAPIIILIHGYKFSPYVAHRDPHSHILSLNPRPTWKAISWPRRLGVSVSGPTRGEPLIITLGWEARGTFWKAYRRAAQTGLGLAAVISCITTIRPGAKIQILAHSLGGRVALSALPHLAADRPQRIVLLAAAELQSRAKAWLDCPAGRLVEVLNVQSRENAAIDRLFEWLVAPHDLRDRSIGAGLTNASSRWIDLAVDDERTRSSLQALGFRIPAPDKRICHWSVYLRSGLFDVYRAVLTGDLPLSHLRACLPAQPPKRGITCLTSPLPSLRRGTS